MTCNSVVPRIRPIRSLFISDLYLGFRHSRVRELLSFLMKNEPENLYLVGDFIDGWCLQKGGHWPHECNLIVERLMDLARQGTRIRLAIGNYDNFLRCHMIQRFIDHTGVIEVAEEFQHRTADGRSFLVLHGDQFDHYEKASTLTVGFLCLFYECILRLNTCWSRLTSTSVHGKTSLVVRVKNRLSSLGYHVRNFRSQIIQHARLRGCHGVICGHIHAPQTLDVDGLTYCNTGDWVENCTALIEDYDGRLHLVWPDESHAATYEGPADEHLSGKWNPDPCASNLQITREPAALSI